VTTIDAKRVVASIPCRIYRIVISSSGSATRRTVVSASIAASGRCSASFVSSGARTVGFLIWRATSSASVATAGWRCTNTCKARTHSAESSTLRTIAKNRLQKTGRRPASSLPYLGEQIRCVLCLSSITILGTNIFPELLAQAVRFNLLSERQALNLVAWKAD
jgi:hypothetical protein